MANYAWAKYHQPVSGMLVRLLFISYVIFLALIVFGFTYQLKPRTQLPAESYGQTNLVPFKSIYRYTYAAIYWNKPHHTSKRRMFINIGGNIALFIPWGLLAPLVWPLLQQYGPLFATSLLLTLFIELVQLFGQLGHFDVDDMITNLVGASLGWLFFYWKFPAIFSMTFRWQGNRAADPSKGIF